MSRLLLNVADVRRRSRVNGPGVRSVVWVQGCTIGCPGCFNPRMHAHQSVRLLDPKRLGLELASVPGTDGIAISGGEPFEQAEACAVLASTVKAAHLSVVVFTGHPYAQLQASTLPCVRRLMASIDLLIAGPYIEDQQCDGTLWRASGNQTVHVFTRRMQRAIHAMSRSPPVVELTLDGTRVFSAGFPAEEDRLWLDRMLSHTVSGDKPGETQGV